MLHFGIIIAIAVGGVFLLALLYVFIRWCRFRSVQLKLPLLEQRDGAFSISGNLVRELYVPITNYYTITSSLLGRGSSAEVVIGRHIRTKRRYAIKIIDTSKKEIIWRYDREKNFLKDIEHPNVTRLFEVFVAPTQLFFVTDLCKGGHLGHILRQRPHGFLDEFDARKYIKQVLSALIHVHRLGICHRDVKLQNIMRESSVTGAQVKLIDFGNSVRYVNNLPLTKLVGTTYTAAPEVFRKEYDERCDIWSLGVVSYILLCGKRPFEKMEAEGEGRHKDEGIINSILAGKFHFKHRQFGCISEEAVDFVKVSRGLKSASGLWCMCACVLLNI
ncbi:hypothetical protein EON64_04560 [archaeon]|nr:MAG: hypothetical protein EON64_04560 [archaeon]